MRVPFALVLWLWIFSLCGSIGASEAPSGDTVAIAALQRKMVTAWNAGDLESLIAHYTTDATILVADMPAIRGRESIASLSKGGIEAGTRLESLEPISVLVKGDVAVVHASYTSLSPGRDGRLRDSGNLLAVLHKQPDGRWLVGAESWTRTRSEAVLSPP